MVLGKKKKKKKTGKDSERKNLVLGHTGNQVPAQRKGAVCREAFCAKQQAQWVLYCYRHWGQSQDWQVLILIQFGGPF